MNPHDQYSLLLRIDELLHAASNVALRLPDGMPLIEKITEAQRIADRWRCDQAAELPEVQSRCTS